MKRSDVGSHEGAAAGTAELFDFSSLLSPVVASPRIGKQAGESCQLVDVLERLVSEVEPGRERCPVSGTSNRACRLRSGRLRTDVRASSAGARIHSPARAVARDSGVDVSIRRRLSYTSVKAWRICMPMWSAPLCSSWRHDSCMALSSRSASGINVGQCWATETVMEKKAKERSGHITLARRRQQRDVIRDQLARDKLMPQAPTRAGPDREAGPRLTPAYLAPRSLSVRRPPMALPLLEQPPTDDHGWQRLWDPAASGGSRRTPFSAS